MGLLAVFALNARSEAERQRSEAEGLVEFMLTDLRDRLKGVGRLDVMTAVNERALHYYGDEDLDRLSVDSLERRARILHAMGEDDETRGDHDAALKKFREAARTTAALLAEAPNDPERIYDHAQSEYYFGLVDYDRGRYQAAKPAFLKYKALADNLVSIAPDNPSYRQEVGYADSNLCTIALSNPVDPPAALGYCGDALAQTERALIHVKQTEDVTTNLIDRHAWLSDAHRASGNVGKAIAERLIEERMLNGLIERDPKNMDLKDTWVALQRALAALDKQAGHAGAARARLQHALNVIEQMIRYDQANNEWIKDRDRVSTDINNLEALKEENK
jgi:tetratricopeptide (TPR) repeat protein